MILLCKSGRIFKKNKVEKAEIKNFIRIYLQAVFDEQNNGKGDSFDMLLESQEFFLQEDF